MVISNAFNEPKLFVPKTNFFPVEIFPKFIQAKIVPIRTIIDETTNSPLSQLVTGTNNPPKSTEIPKQETKEVYDKALSDYVKERQSAK
jgi:hypothetical protein